MGKTLVITLALVALLSGVGFAGDGPGEALSLPGSAWISAGSAGPAEPRNLLVQSGFEQGVVLWRRGSWLLVPYVGLSLGNDTAGYVWNDRHPATFAVKLTRRGAGGVVQLGGGVIVERERVTDAKRHPMAFAQYWTGWHAERGRPGASGMGFPGHTWASSGVLTGQDPDNWITAFAVEQGAQAYQWGGTSAVPFVGGGGTFDTKRRSWENRLRYELGVKAVRPIGGAVIEAGVAQRREHLFVADVKRSGPVMFVNLWIGWNPKPF